jgi:hypothetical protein
VTTFTHLRTLDPAWQPGPGQRYADAPKARCRVTRMTKTTVYYSYADGSGRFSMTREKWDRDYAAPATTERITAMSDTLTTAQVDAAIRAWAKGDYASQASAEIIINTTVRDDVVENYLDWDEDRTMARPNLRKLLKDEESGKVHLSTSAYFLVTLAANVHGGTTAAATDLTGLWHLDMTNRRAVLDALSPNLLY